MANAPPPLWVINVNLRVMCRVASTACLLIFVALVTITTVIADRVLTLSEIIAASHGATVTYGMVVLLHTYSLAAYLVIMTGYIAPSSLHFRAVAASCAMYVMALIGLTYFPVTTHDDPHNAFAVTAFGFATASTWAHRHGIFDDAAEAPLLTLEFALVAVIVTTGLLFWINGWTIAEYVFIALIIMDKELKLTMLTWSGVYDASAVQLQYVATSRKNRRSLMTSAGF